MKDTLPLFKSHYSLGKSILTLEKPEDVTQNGPDSIISLCKENKIKKFFLIEDNMSSFLQAYSNCKGSGVFPIFGLRLNICPDLNVKDEDQLNKTSKIIIISKNEKGYRSLIKIFTKASREGFYKTVMRGDHEPRIDAKTIKTFYNEDDLLIAFPYYDSYLHLNSIENKSCIVDLPFCEPVYFKEENDLPFNFIIDKAIDRVAPKGKVINVKTIYYNKKEDFKSYLAFRCITGRKMGKSSDLDKPNLDHMSSNEFCIESWKENNER